MEPDVSRRRALAAVVGAATALAGCATGDGDGDGGTTEDATTAETDDGEPGGEGTATDRTDDGTADDRTTTGGGADDLDLREANVTGVTVESRGDDEYRLSVTLYHDDDGEDGYANWWQVETLDGERLGRRELLHAHGTREFTRSETVAIPDADRVVVRGHDQTHGYGGQAALVTIPDGEVAFARQGPEPESFADR